MRNDEMPQRPMSRASAFVAAWALSSVLVTLLSAATAIRMFGTGPLCEPTLLFFRISRQSDYASIANVVAAGAPYASGLQYLPGAVLLLDLLNWIARITPPATFAPFLAPAGDFCPYIEPNRDRIFDGGFLALGLIGILATGLIVTFLLLATASRTQRIIGFALTVIVSGWMMLSPDAYPVSALLVGTVVGGLAAVFLIWRRRVPRLVLVPLVGANYPLVYALDRGNLDVAAYALVVVAMIILVRSPRTPAHRLAGILGIVAAGMIKLFPFFLAGIPLRGLGRRGTLPYVLIGVLAAAIVFIIGSIAAGQSIASVAVAIPRNLGFLPGNEPDPNDLGSSSIWVLFSNRTLFGFFVHVDLLANGWEIARTRYETLGPGIRIIQALAPFAALLISWRMRGPLWLAFTTASLVLILFGTGGGTYRLLLLVIATGLIVHALDQREVHETPREHDSTHTGSLLLIGLIGASLGAATSPWFLSAAGGIEWTQQVPSDPLFGVLPLLTLALGLYLYRRFRT